MEVAYVAQTESCVFLLDGDGFCRATIPSPEADDAARKAAQRCVDAQYVASLDLAAEGLLVSEPRAGRQLLFAKVNAQGRVALIRTAPLLEMRSLDGVMPTVASPEPETIALDEEPEETASEEDDDCSELTAPFSRERPTTVEPEAPRARESAPVTLAAPRTVRGFPPPPPIPIPIASRRGILPRRA